MKKKFFTILLALVAGIGFSWATTTVTWNYDDITGSGNSFTKDGVTITAGKIDFYDRSFSHDGTFTTTLGNFTKIEVTARYVHISGTGWSGSTWTGNASSVSFSGDIMDRGKGNIKFVFTIEPATADVTGVTLSQSEAAMTVGGEAVTLTATVAPDNATDKTVTWTSSDPTVATVADGVVTAVAAGTATITATATNGTDDTTDDKTATCTITVTDPDQEAADAIVALFDALPADITLEDKAAIEAARAAYEALTDEQKALVTPEDLAKLTAAEAALAALESNGVENVQGDRKNTKVLNNGHIYILRGDKIYTVQGQEIK